MEQVRTILRESMRSLRGYLKAQIMMLGVIFILYSIGLSIIRVPYSILKAAGIALVDFIPIAGSGLIMIPWAIYTLIQGKRNLALSLAIVFVVIAVLRMVIEPVITGRQVGLHPLLTVFATVAGSVLMGPVGVVLGPMVAVVFVTMVRLNSISTVENNERQERRNRRRKRT